MLRHRTTHGVSLYNVCLAVLRPLVLAANLFLLLGGEVVRDIECLADFLGRLPLDHVRDRLAANIKEGLDVQIVGCLRTY